MTEWGPVAAVLFWNQAQVSAPSTKGRKRNVLAVLLEVMVMAGAQGLPGTKQVVSYNWLRLTERPVCALEKLFA